MHHAEPLGQWDGTRYKAKEVIPTVRPLALYLYAHFSDSSLAGKLPYTDEHFSSNGRPSGTVSSQTGVTAGPMIPVPELLAV